MDIKALLDELTERYNTPDFITRDPIQFPRLFNRLQDIEISAVLTSVLAWGKRSMVLRDADRLHTQMNYRPFDFIMNREWEAFENSRRNIHRTIFEEDIWKICNGLFGFYSEHASLETLFADGIETGIHRLAGLFGCKHVSSPSSKSKSPCKRTNMMLRWLVRNDGIVDMGIWKNISPARLIIPLDVHVSRTARLIWKELPAADNFPTAVAITARLAALCPDDPCKYDFALFGAGEEFGKDVTAWL